MKDLQQSNTLTDIDKSLLEELKRTILQHVPDAALFLYGSTARGTRQPDSDYDVLVLLKSAIATQEEELIQDAVYELELARNVIVSLVFTTADQWNLPVMAANPFRKNVEKDAIQL